MKPWWWRYFERMKATEASRAIYYKPDGSGYLPGERFMNPDHTRTLQRLADGGPREFYEGELARELAADLAANGSFITADDLANYQVRVSEPIRISYRGQTVLTNPPAGGGICMAQTLKIVFPVVILVIFLILYLTYHDFADAVLMMLAVPEALAGGAFFLFLFPKLVNGWHSPPIDFSVAVWVGFIACFGMATETGIIMLVYLREAIDKRGSLKPLIEDTLWTWTVPENRIQSIRKVLGLERLLISWGDFDTPSGGPLGHTYGKAGRGPVFNGKPLTNEDERWIAAGLAKMKPIFTRYTGESLDDFDRLIARREPRFGQLLDTAFTAWSQDTRSDRPTADEALQAFAAAART